MHPFTAIRKAGLATEKRTKGDVEDVEDYGGEGGKKDQIQRPGNAAESSAILVKASSSSSSQVPTAELEMDFDSDVEENAGENSEYESEDLG